MTDSLRISEDIRESGEWACHSETYSLGKIIMTIGVVNIIESISVRVMKMGSLTETVSSIVGYDAINKNNGQIIRRNATLKDAISRARVCYRDEVSSAVNRKRKKKLMVMALLGDKKAIKELKAQEAQSARSHYVWENVYSSVLAPRGTSNIAAE